MKITFKTDYDGKVYEENNEADVLEELGLTETELTLSIEIAKNTGKGLFSLLPNRTFYIALPLNKLEDKDYIVVKALFLRNTNATILTNHEDFVSIYPENNDVMFTTEEEANEFATKKNRVNEILSEIEEKTAEVDSLTEELKNAKKEVTALRKEYENITK